MIYPNSDCLLFCDWMLNISWQPLSNPRLAVINTVYNAAIAQTTVTQNEWNNFTLVTAWRYPYYKVYADLQGGYISQAQNWFNQLFIQPSTSYKNAINTFIQTCINDGNWSKLDRIWIFATEQEQHCTVSLVNPTSTKLSIGVQPTFTPLFGYTGNGTTQYLKTNFNAATQGSQYTLNSASLGAYIRTNAATSTTDVGCSDGSSNRMEIFANHASGSCFGSSNTTAYANVAVASAIGMNVIQRSTSTLQTYYKNGASIATNALASTSIPSYDNFVLCKNGAGTPLGFTARQSAMIFFGSGAINQAAFYTAFQTFATTIGFQV